VHGKDIYRSRRKQKGVLTITVKQGSCIIFNNHFVCSNAASCFLFELGGCGCRYHGDDFVFDDLELPHCTNKTARLEAAGRSMMFLQSYIKNQSKG
jgi:hypothetical protein